MHDLMILFSTLGGILAFGPVGFIVGPVLAGLFVTSWEIFGVAFRDDLSDGPGIVVPGSVSERLPHPAGGASPVLTPDNDRSASTKGAVT
jgi:hypothetical protein